MPRRAFRLAYDGHPFYGFQRQPTVPTVEDALFAACSELGIAEGVPDGYAAAGRTDAGVSALAQTLTLEVPDWCSPHALNGRLPDSMGLWASAEVPPDFHATHDAAERRYDYFLHAGGLDGDRVRTAAAVLAGEHDFADLTTDDDGTVRELSIECAETGAFLRLTVRAGGFPRGLVRRLAELLREIGAGEAPPSKAERVVGPEPVTGGEGVPPAPPGPLVLADVTYPGVAFRVEDRAARRCRRLFDDRSRALAGRARALEGVVDGIGATDRRGSDDEDDGTAPT